MNMASSSSAVTHVLPRDKYDVFLSFRGIDTRKNFSSHLYESLKQKKVDTYMDGRLERGEIIEHALMKAIEQSKISIIVFSKNYASSRWCLDELVHILKCKQSDYVIPVFYEIDPSHVRRQKGTYADAFVTHEVHYKDNMDKLLIWRDALSTAASLSGFPSQNARTDAELVETIVCAVLAKLNRNSSIVVKGLVGFESQIQQIESLLCIEAQDVEFRLVGIWGMGGIGKTTLADAVYHRLSSNFDSCTFLSNVREESEKRGIHHLRNVLFRKLLMDESISIDSPSIGSHSILDRLARTKALVVLDDVNESEQLEYLLGHQVAFGCGSRVIITSRDRRPLTERVDDDHIYKVAELNDADALELFHLKASKDGASKIANPDFLKEVASYAKGIPLVLKVLGSLFRHCNSEKDCKDKMTILKKFHDKKIQDVLRVSYNGLQEYEKGIFLDIACFFKGEKVHDAERLIEMHGFYAPLQGIAVLTNMSLISISKNNCLEMHDLLQEMGMRIVHEQCVFEPGRRNRLWSAEDVYQVLQNNTGTATVEAIFLDMSTIQELHLSRTAFTNFSNLRLLKFYSPCTWKYHIDAASKVYLAQGLQSLPECLRYLYWIRCRLKSLRLEFLPCNLVELHMSHSLIEKLWSDGKSLGSLKVIDLSHSDRLCEVPGLTHLPNIEVINLSECESLAEMPSYFKNLEKLTSLNLKWCKKLTTFPNEMSCNMRFLDLSSCSYLTNVPDLSCCANIEKIDLSFTKVVEIPLYFQHLDKLTYLNLSHCPIEYIPQLPCNLEVLVLFDCTRLKKLHKSIYKLNRLGMLYLSSCRTLEKLPPFSVGLCSLKNLHLRRCARLRIPDGLICLSSLHNLTLDGSMIESIPGSIKYVSGLRILRLRHCKKLQSLPELPPLVEILDAAGCMALRRVASSRTTMHQAERPYYRRECVELLDCVNLNASSRRIIMDDARSRIMQMASSKIHKTRRPNDDHDVTKDSSTVIYPGNEIPEWFSYRSEGCSIEIEFSPNWFHTTDFLGFALCVVFEFSVHYGFRCQCDFKTNNGESYGYIFGGPQNMGFLGDLTEGKTNSDHVVWYFTKGEQSGAGGRPIPFAKVVKASLHFFKNQCWPSGKMKACGIRLLYAHDSGCVLRNICAPVRIHDSCGSQGSIHSYFSLPDIDETCYCELHTREISNFR